MGKPFNRFSIRPFFYYYFIVLFFIFIFSFGRCIPLSFFSDFCLFFFCNTVFVHFKKKKITLQGKLCVRFHIVNILFFWGGFELWLPFITFPVPFLIFS